jgi:hypothetical protein
MPKIKPVKNPKHGEVTAFCQEIVRMMDDKSLTEEKRAVAITYVSVMIQRKFPVLQRETRRRLAARILEEERKRRKENNHAT